jgi:NADH-quinone oxidoreductase subunit L
MVVNRVGDAAIILGMYTIYYTYKSVDYSTIFTLTPYLINDTIIILGYEIKTLTLIGILILIGAAGKSAQLGLHT